MSKVVFDIYTRLDAEIIDRIRTAYIMYDTHAIGTITHEYSSLTGEFQWIIKLFYNVWEEDRKKGIYHDIAGIDDTKHKEEYVRRFNPEFVTQRTLPSCRPDLHELLEKIHLTENDLFEVLCRTHGACGNDLYYVSRTPDITIDIHDMHFPYDIPDWDTSNYGWIDNEFTGMKRHM